MIPILAMIAPYRNLLLAGAAIAALAFGWLYVRTIQHDLAVAKVAAVVTKDKGALTDAQIAAQADGATIADRGAQRDSLSITLHEAHANALQAAPGSTAPVDRALNDTGRRGLCGYASYAADPGCAGLLIRDPAQLPSPGPGHTPSAG